MNEPGFEFASDLGWKTTEWPTQFSYNGILMVRAANHIDPDGLGFMLYTGEQEVGEKKTIRKTHIKVFND